MPVEAERGALLLKVQNCIPAFQQVAELLGVMQGSMDDGEAVSISRVRALSQPLQVLTGNRLPGKQERDTDPHAQDIVLWSLDQILVVVAQDRLCAVLANQPQALGGSRPVADDIPEAEDLIDPLPSDVLKHGLEGINVAMDIGEESNAGHWRGQGMEIWVESSFERIDSATAGWTGDVVIPSKTTRWTLPVVGWR